MSLPREWRNLSRKQSLEALLAVVALAFLLGIAGFATALAVPSSTPAATHATCTKAGKLRRQRAVSSYKKAMPAARKRYFKHHERPRLRARFVTGQRARLRRLTKAAACTVPKKPASSSTTSTRPPVTTVASPPATEATSTTTTTTTAPAPTTTSSATTTTTTTVPAPPPATVVVVSTGFSQQSSSANTDVDYGIVLRNTSPDRDARNVQVTVNAVGAQNVVLDTNTSTVLTIPAGSTYYFGGRSFYSGSAVTTRLDAVAQVGESVAKESTLPAPANVRLEPSSLGGVEVLGEVKNTAATPLSSFARITAVLFDSQGRVVGGGSGSLESDVPPGARIGFRLFATSVPPAGAASAQVSIEPEYDPASPASALVTVPKHGFSEALSSSTRELDYGVVLRNVSPDRDVKGVHVTVSAIDAQNVVIRSESTRLEAIAADSTYYYGGWLFHSASQTTTALEVFVQADGSAAKAVVQPVPANVRVQPVPGGGVQVIGDVTNAASAPLSSLAAITAVVFDAGGNVIGGGLAFPVSDVPPGARAGFTAYAFSVPAGQAASAQVSVEPAYH